MTQPGTQDARRQFLDCPGHSGTVGSPTFLSNDCTSHLFKTLFSDSDIAKKFASARTKTKSIITGVSGPYAQKILLSELGTHPFSVSVDASNHNQLKLFPLVIRFFNAKVGVQVRLLNLRWDLTISYRLYTHIFAGERPRSKTTDIFLCRKRTRKLRRFAAEWTKERILSTQTATDSTYFSGVPCTYFAQCSREEIRLRNSW